MQPTPAARHEPEARPAVPNGRAAVSSQCRRQAHLRRQQLLAILGAATEPPSTTELTERLDATQGGVVLEEVYRSLQILAHHGKVHRIPTKGKAVRWELGADPAARTHSAARTRL